MFHLKLFKKINPCLLINNKNPLKLISSISNKLANEDKRKLIEEKFSYLKDYKQVYKIDVIRLVTALSRLKIYQSIFTVSLGIATTTMYFNTSTISLQGLLMTNLASICGLVSLIFISKLLSKIICVIYLHKNGNDVIISHINFFSRRNNIFTTIDNITPLYNSMREMETTYSKFQLNDSEGSMYYSLKYGIIMNKEDFKKVMRIHH